MTVYIGTLSTRLEIVRVRCQPKDLSFKESGQALFRSHEHNDIAKEESLVRDMVLKTREYIKKRYQALDK